MKNKYLLILIIISYSMRGFAISNKIKSDFILPSNEWFIITAADLRGKHEIFNIKNDKEYIFLYRISPGGETGIKEHDTWEEVAIVSGTLEWLDTNGKSEQILGTGAYVNRAPHVKHGPFKAGKHGCVMYVKMHS